LAFETVRDFRYHVGGFCYFVKCGLTDQQNGERTQGAIAIYAVPRFEESERVRDEGQKEMSGGSVRASD
jgi:hypothetical protein